MSSIIDGQLALRLGLASKALPQMGLEAFIKHLMNELGEPLSEKKLRSLNPKKLYQSLIGVERDIERGQSNQAYAILTSSEVSKMEAPVLPENTKVMGPKIRVAVSSNNQEQLDGHFGSCLRFLIYEVNGRGYKLVEVRPVCTDDTGLSRTDYLIELIKDCHMLSTLSIGGPAAAKVVRADLLPVKQKAVSAVSEVLEPLVEVIANNPPPWMQKILTEQEGCHECGCGCEA